MNQSDIFACVFVVVGISVSVYVWLIFCQRRVQRKCSSVGKLEGFALSKTAFLHLHLRRGIHLTDLLAAIGVLLNTLLLTYTILKSCVDILSIDEETKK